MLENLILYDYNEQTYILRLHINKYGYIRINKTNQRILFNMTFSDGMYESYTLSFDDSINILSKKWRKGSYRYNSPMKYCSWNSIAFRISRSDTGLSSSETIHLSSQSFRRW